jgi:hypothetical protein
MVHPDTQMPERDDEFVGKIEQLQRSITDWQLEADVHRKRAAAAVAEIERHREAIRRLAEQDATLSVCNGNVIVDMDATLTDAERRGMDTDNTQGVNEPSPASAGSQPFAWAVTPTGKDGEIDCEFVYPCEATAGDVALGCNGVVVPLYRQPTLTDEEWEAVWLAIGMFAEGPEHIKRHEEMADALRGLLERLGGAR